MAQTGKNRYLHVIVDMSSVTGGSRWNFGAASGVTPCAEISAQAVQGAGGWPPCPPPRAKSLRATADEWLAVQGASSAWFWNIACTHTLMHCLLFAVFFNEERALLLMFFFYFVQTFWMEGLTRTEPPLSRGCCVGPALYPPIAQFLFYGRI